MHPDSDVQGHVREAASGLTRRPRSTPETEKQRLREAMERETASKHEDRAREPKERRERND